MAWRRIADSGVVAGGINLLHDGAQIGRLCAHRRDTLAVG
jgi:hypothetical protein